MRSFCCLLVLMSILVTGCSEPPADLVPGTPAASGVPVAAAEVSEAQPPADRSLALNEYLESGIPSIDRTWSGVDLERAVGILEQIASRNGGHVPRYQSPSSGGVFDRLTTERNLELYRNRSLPLEARFPDAMQYLQAVNQLAKLYVKEYLENSVGDSELVEVVGATLRITVVMLELVNEFLPTLDPADPTYPTRMAGLQQMKSGMAEVVAGALQTLTEPHRTSELKRLCNYLAATLPAIFPELSEGGRTEAKIQLQTFLNDPKMQRLNPELQAIVSAVEEIGRSN